MCTTYTSVQYTYALEINRGEYRFEKLSSPPRAVAAVYLQGVDPGPRCNSPRVPGGKNRNIVARTYFQIAVIGRNFCYAHILIRSEKYLLTRSSFSL